MVDAQPRGAIYLVSMQSFAVELATRSDLPRIVELSNWYAERTTANLATRPEPLEDWVESWLKTAHVHPWLVARSGGAVIGFARSAAWRNRDAFDWTAKVTVYVSPERHGQGVGTALYGALISLMRAQGYATLVAGITDGNAASERFHARTGFVRCATMHRIGWKLGRWYDVGFWELHLQPARHVPQPIRPVAEVWQEATP